MLYCRKEGLPLEGRNALDHNAKVMIYQEESIAIK